MLRKAFCFGLGLAGVLLEKFNELACAGEERLAQRKSDNNGQEIEVTVVTEAESPIESGFTTSESTKVDDLTAINGIGPTFAKRLKEAGITTYSELAAHTSDQLKEITRAADWQANPDEWILQAKAVA